MVYMLKSFCFSQSAVALLFSSLALLACEKQQMSGNTTIIPMQPDTAASAAKTYLALGDSYTIGQSVQANERFPYLTAKALRSQGLNVQDPQYIATTGWTTVDLQTAINQENPGPHYDIVTLLIGVNDQYQHRDTADYRIRFTQLLNKAISLADNRRNRVFVLSIPDYSATPFVGAGSKAMVSTEIGWFNAINKEITLQYHIAYIDITPLTLEVATDASLQASDNLHYSGKEHQKWADLLAPVIRNSF
jgi:lysophospholipase L1-like esterase